jgi:hypothetical protein
VSRIVEFALPSWVVKVIRTVFVSGKVITGAPVKRLGLDTVNVYSGVKPAGLTMVKVREFSQPSRAYARSGAATVLFVPLMEKTGRAVTEAEESLTTDLPSFTNCTISVCQSPEMTEQETAKKAAILRAAVYLTAKAERIGCSI